MREQLARLGTYGLAPLARAGVRTPERFVVYCPPRTGSTMLTTLLDSHPDIRCEGELLARRVPQPLRWFDGRAAKARLDGHSAWGCKVITLHTKWFPDAHGTPRDLIERLVEHGYHLIVLRRRNWLLQALSIVHAEHNRYHYTRDDKAAFEAMHVDPVEVLSALVVAEREADHLDETIDGLPHLAFTYEDDLHEPAAQQRTANRIGAALGLPPEIVRTRQVAIAPPSVEGRVANLRELSDLLERTRFASFLPAHQQGARVVPYGPVDGAPGAIAADGDGTGASTGATSTVVTASVGGS